MWCNSCSSPCTVLVPCFCPRRAACVVPTLPKEWWVTVARTIWTAICSWRQKLRKRRSRLRRLADTQAGSRSTFIMSSAREKVRTRHSATLEPKRLVVVVVLLLVVVCVCVCCGTLKKLKEKSVWIQKRLRVCIQKRPRVCRHHVHMCFNMYAWCRYTRGRFERTHGDVLNPHTEGRGSSSVLLTKICPRMVIT